MDALFELDEHLVLFCVDRERGAPRVRRLEWNADPVIGLHHGTVALVDTLRGTNDIGVHVASEDRRAGVVRVP